jgi:poly-gamma-glutamate capsule biosynthesis protein CapA/YwtB (metallophosphatase superfamily)
MKILYISLFITVFYITGFSQSGRNDKITVTAVGDIMMGSNYPSVQNLPADDGVNSFEGVKEILRTSDITFGNLEGTFLNSGGLPKKCNDSSLCYLFRMPEHYADYLVDAGFNLINIANNHMGDFGDTGISKTISVLKEHGLNFAGVPSAPYSIFKKGGITYSLCAFSPNSYTLDLRNIPEAVKLVKKLKSISDIVIVSFHGGGEGARFRHVTKKTEIFADEDRGNVYEFAHAVIDAGAGLVLGHGPHVARAIELYKNHFITYSMGNFCTNGDFNIKGFNGIMPVFKLELNKKGEFLSGKIYPATQKQRGHPIIDPEGNIIKEIDELTKQDFPEGDLEISPDGTIIKKIIKSTKNINY